MTAVIVCNGRVRDYSYYKKYLDEAVYIISVDGGAAHLRKFKKKPDLMLGDFDSISPQDMEFYLSTGTVVEKFPAEKDMTDAELALEVAISKGFKKVIVIGGVGTRFDHSIANIFLLRKLLDKGINGIIVDEYNEITLIKDKIVLQRENDTKVTLVPLSDKVEGVSTKGLYYPLKKATIHMGSTWGVSNEFTQDIAEVTLDTGLLLVIKARD